MGNNITYNDDLEKYINRTILKNKNFLGVYPQDFDKKVLDKHSRCCLVLNTSPRNEEGEHWMGLWKENGKVYLFDSFGRNPERIAPILNKRIGGQLYYDDDQIQGNNENNCGQRTIAWLICCAKYGVKNSMKL